MLYLIGLGLNDKGYSREAYDAISKADKIYVESYTVEFPYNIKTLEKQFQGKKFVLADRGFVENMKDMLKEAKENDVALLVYGSPLFATTHISILEEARKLEIEVKIIHSASVFDAIAECGLQLYKFGKIASMPNFEADSYVEIIKDNQSIKAHTLILIDIGMSFKDAVEKLKMDCDGKVSLDKIIICEQLGTNNSYIRYDTLENLKGKRIKAPFCLIIPSELHFMEKEFLEF